MSVRALLLSGLGLNCEDETAAALRQAGALCTTRSLHDFFLQTQNLELFELIVFPGGFSYGDALGSGQVLAHRLRHPLHPDQVSALQTLQNFVRDGGFILGICNGFQVLCRSGLLPFGDGRQVCSLARNASDRFEDRWLRLAANPQKALPAFAQKKIWELPVRHGEGRLVFIDDETQQRVQDLGLDVLHYADASGQPTQDYPDNPNGSALACAALSDPSGRILGMMPHPEAALSFYNHPDWPTRRRRQPQHTDSGDGLLFFRQMLAQIERERGAKNKAAQPGHDA